MERDLIIGVDAGTSVMKAVAFSQDGQELAIATRPNQVHYGRDGRAEQDMDATWRSLAEVLAELVLRLPDLGARAAALAITGQGDGTWLVDAQARPVGRALLWLDGRSGERVREWQRSGRAERITAITGTGLNTSQQGPQLSWLAEHEPERLRAAQAVMHCKDWLYLCCTGRVAGDLSEGLFTYGNPRTMDYDETVIDLLGLAGWRHLLPPLVDGRREHAPLTAAAARATGLPAGLPVVLAPMDVTATALGAGLFAPGRSVGCSILGSTGMHGRLYRTLQDVPASARQGYLLAFPVPGSFHVAISHMAATLNADWLCDRIAEAAVLAGGSAPSREVLLGRLEQLAASAPPGSAMFHPFIAENGERGPFTEPLARAQFTGLSASTTLAGLGRAVWEGVALATRDCYEVLGPLPEEIRLTGGAARSGLLRGILADVMGCPVRVSRRGEAGAAGAAMVAGVSVGRWRDVTEATPQWVDAMLEPHCTEPGPARERYQALYAAYTEGYRHQFAHWRALQRARELS